MSHPTPFVEYMLEEAKKDLVVAEEECLNARDRVNHWEEELAKIRNEETVRLFGERLNIKEV